MADTDTPIEKSLPQTSPESAVPSGGVERGKAPVEQHEQKETTSEKRSSGRKKEKDAAAVKPAPSSTDTNAQPAVSAKSKSVEEIEEILEEDLGEVYQEMDYEHQQMFKETGEQTARQIDDLLKPVKVKAKKIFELIKAWLVQVPGLSKWFVVQESKIKTDKIIRAKQGKK